MNRTRPFRVAGDRGEVTSTVAVFPVLLTLLLVVVQAALAWHARAVVDAAAADAVTAARTDGATAADGRRAADAVLRDSRRLLPAPDVTVERSADRTTARVEAEVVRVLPLIPTRLRATAEAPTERFRGTGP